jgi:uncharacterized protein (DUF3084 family)
MAEDRARLQSLTDEYQDLQNDLSNLVSARQKLESQQQENQSVQKVIYPHNHPSHDMAHEYLPPENISRD